MRFAAFVMVSLMLGVACSGGSPDAVQEPAVDLAATVEAAVEATRSAEREPWTPVPTAIPVSTATPLPTATPEPTATPVPTATYVPTPEPYVAAPGSMERGIEELYACLQESEELRAAYLVGMEQSGLSRELADSFTSLLLQDEELFTQMMLVAAEQDSKFASKLSLDASTPGGICDRMAQIPTHGLSMSDSDAEALLGEVFDCYSSDSALKELVDYHMFRMPADSPVPDDVHERLVRSVMSDKDFFVGILLMGAREDPDVDEALADMDSMLDARCR